MNPAVAATIPVETFTVDTGLPALTEGACATVVQPPPTPEQIQAAEAVFSQSHQPDPAFTLFAVWTSTILLRDLAFDAFSPSEEDRKKATALRLGKQET